MHRRRALGAARSPVSPHVEGAHLRPDGRDRRRSDDFAAGGNRRRAELGLPLLLAARRDAHAARVPESGLHRRGACLARLAAPRDCRRSRRHSGHVRRRRREAAGRARAAMACGVRRLTTCSHRERRRGSAPTRRLRRDRRRAAHGAQARPRGVRSGMGLDQQGVRLARERLAGARSGNLGSAWPAPALHALQGHGLGGVRPRGEGDRATRPRGGRSTAGARRGTRSATTSCRTATARSEDRSCSTTAPNGWMQACC